MNPKTDWSDPEARREYFREYRRNHRQQMVAYQRAYVEKNRDAYREYQRDYRRQHPEKVEAYRKQQKLRNA